MDSIILSSSDLIYRQEVRRNRNSPTILYTQEAKGHLVKVMPGAFINSEVPVSYVSVMQWISKKQSQVVMNLISALSFHEMTTQIPAYLSVALPRGAYLPKVNILPVKVCYITKKLLTHGFEMHEGLFGPFRVTTKERTLVDCFKYRNKIGLNIFLEALRMGKSQIDLWKLEDEARLLRVIKQITPYLESN